MGQIASKLRRKYRMDTLERLHTDINNTERDKQRKKRCYNRMVKYTKALSIGLIALFIGILLFLCVGFNYDWSESFVYALPLIFLACLMMPLRSCISWYYEWWLIKHKIKLKEMREEKTKLLEDVMDTENYKIAKPILDKYGIPEESTKPYSDNPEFEVYSNASNSKDESALTSVRIK